MVQNCSLHDFNEIPNTSFDRSATKHNNLLPQCGQISSCSFIVYQFWLPVKDIDSSASSDCLSFCVSEVLDDVFHQVILANDDDPAANVLTYTFWLLPKGIINTDSDTHPILAGEFSIL